MQNVAKTLAFMTAAVFVVGCKQSAKTPVDAAEADSGVVAKDDVEHSASVDPGKPDVPDWKSVEMPEETTFDVVRDESGVRLEREGASALQLRPRLVTEWAEEHGAPTQTVETELEVKSLNPNEDGGFALYLESNDELGSWRVRAENAAGDPRVKFAISGKYGRDVVVHRQELRFAVGESSAEAMGAAHAFVPVESTFASQSGAPLWARFAGVGLTFRGGPGIDGYRIEKASDGWELVVETYNSDLHPMVGRDVCGKGKPADRSPAVLAKKTKVEARWQFIAGQPQVVLRSPHPSAALGAVSVVIADEEPDLERSRWVDIGVPTIDADGALELGIFYTRAIPGGEALTALGAHPKTAKSYGIEHAAMGGKDAETTFRDRFQSVTWWGGVDCSAFENDGWKPGGDLQERLNAGYQLFHGGPVDFENPRAGVFHAYPHKLARGSFVPTVFHSRTAPSATDFAAAISPKALDALKERRGIEVVATSNRAFAQKADAGWAFVKEGKGALLLLARYRNERRLAVAPVADIIGHAAAMQQVDVELLPDGWVRVRNMTARDLKGATFELPNGTSALVAKASEATLEGEMVYFDLPGRGEQVFRVTGAESWMKPAKFVVSGK